MHKTQNENVLEHEAKRKNVKMRNTELVVRNKWISCYQS